MNALRRRWLIILALAAVIVAGSFYDQWRKFVVPEKTASVVPANQSPAARDSRPVVYVTGAVAKPGVYKVGQESRVIDVINAAGGLAHGADANKINLAQAVGDGMQIHVPISGVPNASAAEGSGRVSINAADKAALEKLPGIGAVLAGRIVDYRKAHGPFRDIAELKKVNGIGESKFRQLKDKISL
ncbi:helix-hairpin-helix domain-containing protein [Anaeroselena agilis]|uniref:ComEA family DNA-binding protein n=1 Tax=Anaeroselena agilis TaxID=3063788 RepID=A0ABU3P095_9FIRM|nr:ComEA family DNA-binding protein [Selenomonadales bacterium 4137-cl]